MSVAIPPLPTARRDWLALMQRLGVRPSKGLGQNFLFERGIVQRIVKASGVGPDDLVVEVGPGLGILTEELLRRAGHVASIELDRNLATHLAQHFQNVPTFELVQGDALRVDLSDVIAQNRPYQVVANLPYAVAAAVIRRFLEDIHPPNRMTVMLQREVAERLVARPPQMTILSVATQFFGEPRVAFLVPPDVFIPAPTVESAVAIIDVAAEPPLPREEHAVFFRVVNAGFRQKRKQVANSLAAELDLPKSATVAWLEAAGIDAMRRAQTLQVAEWVALTREARARGIPERTSE